MLQHKGRTKCRDSIDDGSRRAGGDWLDWKEKSADEFAVAWPNVPAFPWWQALTACALGPCPLPRLPSLRLRPVSVDI